MAIRFVLGGILVLLLLVGVLYYVNGDSWRALVKESDTEAADPAAPIELTREPTISEATSGESVNVPIEQERRKLTITYETKVVTAFPGVTRNIASELCSIIADAGTCAWGTDHLTENADLASNLSRDAFAVRVVYDRPPLLFGTKYDIEINDPDARAPEYRIFLIHKDLLARINGVYEAKTVQKGARNGRQIFEWGLEETYIDERGKEITAELRPGTYELMVVDIATGRMGEMGYRFRVGAEAAGRSSTVAYAANTPLINSFWDGRGVFFDGAGGEDTVNMVGKMDMYDIMRGVDFPDRGHYDTLIFLQGGSVVITVVNVENIGFDDRTLTAEELKRMLDKSGGIIYRTEKFEPHP